MRRIVFCALLLFPALLSSEGVLALTESDIALSIERTYSFLADEWSVVEDFTCGGLLSESDQRAVMAYDLGDALSCRYDGDPDEKIREYVCNGAVATCTSYYPHQRYEWFSPAAFNCVLTYEESPVFLSGSLKPPKGFTTLSTPLVYAPDVRGEPRGWEAALGSNASVYTGVDVPQKYDAADEFVQQLLDSSASALMPSDAHTQIAIDVLNNAVNTEGRFADYPSLDQTIGRLMRPPQVRLVLPRGGILQETLSPIFSRAFSSLSGSKDTGPVREVLGNEPDMLLSAAEALRSMPLLEVAYQPVRIRVPTTSRALLEHAIAEWESWLAYQTQNDVLTQDVEEIVQANIETMRSYIALQDSLRMYRSHFPAVLHTLLSSVEEINDFLREYWIERNAEQLEKWYELYSEYLPGLRGVMRDLHEIASSYTSSCLAYACKRDVLPVLPDTTPEQAMPYGVINTLNGGGSELAFFGPDAAWLPSKFPLWEHPSSVSGLGAHGQLNRWHSGGGGPVDLGDPLPDFTLDLSLSPVAQRIAIPVLSLEPDPIDIPFPPALEHDLPSPDFFAPLPRYHPPLPSLHHMALQLPDNIEDVLIDIPPPPIPAVWRYATLMAWQAQRLVQLFSVCDATNPTPTTFLVHEFQLTNRRWQNPGIVRAVQLVGRSDGNYAFSHWSTMWARALVQLGSDAYTLPGTFVSPLPCTECSVLRPHRYIRQRVELEGEWQNIQERFLDAVDEWNASLENTDSLPLSSS